MFENITVNGVPLKAVVDAEDRKEKKEFQQQEIAGMSRSVRNHIITRSMRNVSGARSGKVRILVQNGVWL